MEVSERYLTQLLPFREIPEWRSELGGVECEILTILDVRPHTVDAIGTLLSDEELFELPED